MSQALYRCWLFPAHRIHNAAILAAYRVKSSIRTHRRQQPMQLGLFA